MCIKEIHEFYDIGRVLSIYEPYTGSGDSIIVETTTGKYVYKSEQREDFLEIIRKVNIEIENSELYTNEIISRTDGRLIGSHNRALFSYINGETKTVLSKSDTCKSIEYMSQINKALSGLSDIDLCVKRLNYWDLAKSTEYLVTDFYIELHNNIEFPSKNVLMKAISIVKSKYSMLNELPKQLIHSDLGPEHFIFSPSDKVIGIIDFTPDIKSEFYSLAQFIYWNSLWDYHQFDDVPEQLSYYLHKAGISIEKDLFWIIMLNVCVSRCVGRMLELKDKGRYTFDDSLNRRIEIVEMTLAKCI